jgi:hypothetical protein
MGVHSVSSGVVAFMAAGIHIKSIHVLRWLDLEFCVFFGEAQKRFRVLGSARTREQRASAEHDWVTDPALSPLFRQGAHRGSALRSLQHSDLVFRCETESHCHCRCLTVSSTRVPTLPRWEADIRIGHCQPATSGSFGCAHPLLCMYYGGSRRRTDAAP